MDVAYLFATTKKIHTSTTAAAAVSLIQQIT